VAETTAFGASPNLAAAIRSRIAAGIAVQRGLLDQVETCAAVAERLIAAYQAGGQALLFGNGGSAADAQHLAAELVGRFYLDRAPLPALALTVNTSVLTAIGNDYAFAEIFARQIAAHGRPGDVAIGLSTSGDSANVVEGLRAARRGGLITVGLTGAGGGRIAAVADLCLRVPSSDTPRIQEGHILLGHILCELVERALFGDDGG